MSIDIGNLGHCFINEISHLSLVKYQATIMCVSYHFEHSKVLRFRGCCFNWLHILYLKALIKQKALYTYKECANCSCHNTDLMLPEQMPHRAD